MIGCFFFVPDLEGLQVLCEKMDNLQHICKLLDEDRLLRTLPFKAKILLLNLIIGITIITIIIATLLLHHYDTGVSTIVFYSEPAVRPQ